MFEIIKNIVNDLLALFFSGSILALDASGTYLMMQKEVVNKLQQGGPSLSKFTLALACLKYDKKMNIVRIASGYCNKRFK